MTSWKESQAPEPRRLACSRCGAEFGCDLSGKCWCAEEAAKLPMPAKGEDCLCRACLREAAEAARSRDGAQA
ncbi:cysteine-rich CWC family protein [Bradyrhizobium diazoefficiens]|uniref:cysteine-rich CWC family protein n=1 Tax=Bradyrhizobium diazoefficiens TaxID=1355477 RepID=UPI001FED2DD9|nr:cysteine-rich CWC family protein [Bradyrhizobium diazoefficiens]